MSKTDVINELHKTLSERGAKVVLHGAVTGRWSSNLLNDVPAHPLLLDLDNNAGKSLVFTDMSKVEESLFAFYDSNPQAADVVVIDSFTTMYDVWQHAQSDADAYRWLSMSRDEMDADAFKKQYLCEWTMPEVDDWHKKHGTRNKSLHVEREHDTVNSYKKPQGIDLHEERQTPPRPRKRGHRQDRW